MTSDYYSVQEKKLLITLKAIISKKNSDKIPTFNQHLKQQQNQQKKQLNERSLN